MKRERLEEFNPWWFSAGVPKELLQSFRRKLFYELESSLNKRYVVSIVGLRRTGKTTLMMQIIQKLIDDSVEKSNILYFSFDEYAENLDDLLDTYRELRSKDFRDERIYVFLDEIQKLPDWPNHVKKYYDLYPKLKIFVSGSESLFISSKTKETLAGRISEFCLGTLSFGEYMAMKGANELPFAKMKMLFSEYLTTGGFPEMAGKESREIRDYVKSIVLEKVIYKDIATLFGIKDTSTIRQLVEIIASNPGMYLDYQSLAKQLDKDRRSIKSYIMMLNDSFIIKIMGNYRKGKMSSIRKLKRVYPADTSIIIAFSRTIDDKLMGQIAESAVVCNTDARSFWKNSHEVDIILDDMPIEIKYKGRIQDKDIAGVREFMRKFNASIGMVITKDDERKLKTEEGVVNLIPACVFLSKK